ncbi:hypothetical protein ACPRNU_12620 [Chromobacterium vaccinii]|uniref:hypothetical protein n=1 Tax=Chromobacterium vaccinii TaxID=1108595 RepID=UPI003C784CA5
MNKMYRVLLLLLLAGCNREEPTPEPVSKPSLPVPPPIPTPPTGRVSADQAHQIAIAAFRRIDWLKEMVDLDRAMREPRLYIQLFDDPMTQLINVWPVVGDDNYKTFTPYLVCVDATLSLSRLGDTRQRYLRSGGMRTADDPASVAREKEFLDLYFQCSEAVKA